MLVTLIDKIVTVSIEKGNAVQIQSVQLNTFYNMGSAWDSEYNDTDPNRLADVLFAILKPRLNVFDGTRSNTPNSSWVWYKSETKENESNLNWNLQNEELYINIEELTPYVAFADDDGGNVSQDLMLGPPFEYIIPIVNYKNTKPSYILVKETNINLEYELGLGW